MHGNKGRHRSQEVKDKISKSKLGVKKTEESKRLMSIAKKGKYCGKNNSNYGNHKLSGKNNPNYRGGKSFGTYCEKWNNKLREEIRNKYARKCYLCNKSEEDQMKEQKQNGKRQFRLSVHHIDEDKDQGCNGKSWKLVPLCLVCHAKLHNKKLKILNDKLEI